MKVSIIVPIYKVQEEIERCLLSVISQDYQDIELVLVNDCTPDQSFFIAKEYIKNSAFRSEVTYIEHEKNRGLSEARNSGLRAARGDYVFFLDSDDQIAHKQSISDLISGLKDIEMPDLVVGGSQRIVDNIVTKERVLDGHCFLRNTDIFSTYSSGKLPTTAWGRLINRAFILRERLFFEPNIYYEDDLWSYFVYRKAQTLITINKIVYSYHERAESITTSSLTKKNIDDLYHVISVIYGLYSPQDSQSALIIERLRRSLLKYLFTFKDPLTIDKYLRELTLIRLPLLATYKLKFIEQNLILRLPHKWSYAYFKYKWG
ncbi:glycosyltransferase family 2 protein [Ignatzschineria sp. LJL83]